MKHVLIIGGGFAGVTVARLLDRDFKVTLVDTKPFFEFTPGILRTLVVPTHATRIQLPYTSFLPHVTFIQGDATFLHGKECTVNGTRISFDYCVIAAGSRYALPIKEEHVVLAERAHHLYQKYAALEKARSVVVIGGGLAGVELMAELATHTKGKKLTLVHSHSRVCERMSLRTSAFIAHFLQKKNVTLVLGERVVRSRVHELFLQSGKKIKADLVFVCTGIVPHSELALKSKLPLNERKQLRVSETLQVIDYPYLFGAGDVTDVGVEKTAQAAEAQARVVAYNIKALASGSSLRTYVPHASPLLLSLGPWSGVFEWRGMIFTGLLPGLLKQVVEWKEMWKLRFL